MVIPILGYYLVLQSYILFLDQRFSYPLKGCGISMSIRELSNIENIEFIGLFGENRTIEKINGNEKL